MRQPPSRRKPSPHTFRALTRAVSALGTTTALLALTTTGVQAAAPASPAGRGESDLALASVQTDTAAEQQALAATGLDIIVADDKHAEVLLHSPDDHVALAAGGWTYRTESVDDDLATLDDARAAEAAAAAAGEKSTLPTGRVEYRDLDTINTELKALAKRYPKQVKLFRLPHTTLLGKTVYGVEVTGDVHEYAGKPEFLLTGVHHAREWPTAELTTEFITEAVTSYGTDDRFTHLMDSSRIVVVPVVNADGYDVSRSRINEMKRKNCRVTPGLVPTAADCEDPANANSGVDPNRNYGAFWGGPGSTTNLLASDHHGSAPYSEPEIENMRELVNAHQFTVAINAHTPDERLLRAPSSPLEPDPVEEDLYQSLAESLGSDLGGWPSGPWPEVYYNASGTAEEHAFYTSGTFAFTPELMPGFNGLLRFHPPYEYVADQYWGTGIYQGSSAREAFLHAWEMSTDRALHSVIKGKAPKNIELHITKDVALKSSPTPVAGGGTILTDQHLESTLKVSDDGTFTWNVNPSVRQSQDASRLLQESWTISCLNPAGKVMHSEQVTVTRGASATVNMSECPGGPKRH
ncbi:M14 family zinc carboxypeptidase [Streptomyces sp. NPDC001276]|uniref:M14 family zinc carboxypeptidase n=1 Tax=Streptomyces sp. NPDC001276 TaxID=3364555 RepID=UPI0036ADAD89